MVGGGQAGEGQVAFGPQHGGQVPGRGGGEQGEQLAGGGGVAQLMGGAGGQRPRPAHTVVADPKGADVGESGPGVAQRGLRLEPGGGGEALHQADHPRVLRVLAGAQVCQSRERSLGGRDVAAQRRQPGPRAGQELIVAQRVGVRSLGEFGLGSVPVAEHHQRLSQVADRDGQGGPVASPAQVPGGGPRRLRRRPGIGGHHDVRQVEQGCPQVPAVAGLISEPGAFAVVGSGFRSPVCLGEVIPAGPEQFTELTVADAEGLAQGERLSGQAIRDG